MEGESTSLLQDRSRYEFFEVEDQSELVDSDEQNDSIDEQVEYFRNMLRYWKALLTKPLLLLVLNVSIIIVTNQIYHHLKEERASFSPPSYHDDRGDEQLLEHHQQYTKLEELYFAEFEQDTSWYLQLINTVLALLFAADTIILLRYTYGLIQSIGEMRSELIHLNNMNEEKEKCQLGTNFSMRYTDALYSSKFESMLRTGSCPNESERYTLVNLLHFAAMVCLIGFFQHLTVLTILHFGLIKENGTICSPSHLFHISTYHGNYYDDVLVEVNHLKKIQNIVPKDLFEAATSADVLRLEYGTKVVFSEKREYYHGSASGQPSFASINDGFNFFETWNEGSPGDTKYSLKALDNYGKFVNVPKIGRAYRWGFEAKLGFTLQKEDRLCYAFKPDSVHYRNHIDHKMFCHCSGTFSSYFHNISIIDEKLNDEKFKEMEFLGYKLNFTEDDFFWIISMFGKNTPNPTSMSNVPRYRDPRSKHQDPSIHENPFPRNITQVFSKYDVCTMKAMERVEVTLQINPVIGNEKSNRHNRSHDICTDALEKVLLYLVMVVSPLLIAYSCWKRLSVTPLLIFLPIGVSFQIQVYKHKDEISAHFSHMNSFIKLCRPVLLVAIIVLQMTMISSLTLGCPRCPQKFTRDVCWWCVYGITVMMFLFLVLDNEEMEDGMGAFIMTLEILCILWLKMWSGGPILKIVVVTTMVISVFRMLDRDALDYDEGCIECWIIVFFSVQMWFPLVTFADFHKPMAKLVLRSCLQSLKPKAQRFLQHFSMIDALQKRLSRRNGEQNE